MSWPPSTVDSTERSWMPRFSATDAIPPVRQLARPTRRYSIGVMPLSSAAKTSGWSASNVHSSLWLCSSPRPKKLWTLIVLWTPVCHLEDARQVNCAASGAPFSTSRASSSACTLTPLVTVVMSRDTPLALYPYSRFRCLTVHRLRPAKIAPMAEPVSKLAAGSASTVETQYLDLPEPVRLDCGRELHPVRVAYETYGVLSPRRDNVILVCHALSGDAHAAGFAKAPPAESTRDGFGAEDRDGVTGKGLGWLDGMIGPGKAFDTDRFFVVSTNLLGGCRGTTGPSSVNPATGRPYGPDFPVITVADMVRTERAFLHALGIGRLAAVAGGSLGGRQAFEWAILYPGQVDAVVAIASTHALHPQGVAWNSIARDAIMRDPAWQGGHYYGTGRAPDAGMGLARMVGHVTYLSAQALDDKFGRRLQFADDIRYTITEPEFEVESYLRHQADSFVKRFDANTYLYTSRALTYFDLARQHGSGSLAQALEGVSARTLLIAFSSDWLYPPAAGGEVADAFDAAGKPAEFHVIEAPYGHDCFLLEEARQTPIIRQFLSKHSLAEGGAGEGRRGRGIHDRQALACRSCARRAGPRVWIRDTAVARRATARPEHGRTCGADLPDDQLCVRGPGVSGGVLQPAGVREHVLAHHEPDRRGVRGARGQPGGRLWRGGVRQRDRRAGSRALHAAAAG